MHDACRDEEAQEEINHQKPKSRQAVINIFKLEGKEAKQMEGRSKITFSKTTNRLLKDIEEDEENADMVSRTKWLSSSR